MLPAAPPSNESVVTDMNTSQSITYAAVLCHLSCVCASLSPNPDPAPNPHIKAVGQLDVKARLAQGERAWTPHLQQLRHRRDAQVLVLSTPNEAIQSSGMPHVVEQLAAFATFPQPRDGIERVVPPPEQRVELVQRAADARAPTIRPVAQRDRIEDRA
eukprot:5896134-Prymnesium_polylepis.2